MEKEKDFYQISLKLLLKNDAGEVFALKAVGGGGFVGFYDLPGGRIDVDEFTTDFSEILAREVAEEVGNIEFQVQKKPVALGRHLIPASLTSAGKDIRVLYIFFEAHYVGGSLRTSDEHTGYRWLDLNNINLAEYFTSGILEGVRMYVGNGA